MTNANLDADFVHFLESMGNLDALDRISRELDDELKDCRLLMDEIQGKIDMPLQDENVNSEPKSDDIKANLLTAPAPANSVESDVNNVLNIMKSYTEDLKKNLTLTVSPAQTQNPPKQLENLNLEQYASTLDQLCKRLSSLRLIKRDEVPYRNADLEAKLSLLCDDVNMFSKMVQAKTTLSEANENWSPTQQKTNSLVYDNLINKLLSVINEVSLLLINKN